MTKPFDVIVIGGGATGAGIARDCARRGIRVLLIERFDISTGATGRNHGLLHSGARYAVTDQESAEECIKENRILRRIASHCVEETDGLFLSLPEDGLEFQAKFVEACRAAGIRADVIDLRPKAVVILAGTNDIARNTGRISLEHILDNLQSMVELARANGIRPILCSVPPAGAFGWRPELKPAQDIVRLNGMIRAYADAEGIPYVDYHTPMAAADVSMNADYTKDGVHPTEAGYAVMERILPPVVKRVQAEIGK